jgi:hypothetical protein
VRGLVAYSRPRGEFGPYVFTVVIQIEEGLPIPPARPQQPNSSSQDSVEIQVSRKQKVTKQRTYTLTHEPYEVYSCGYCGRYGIVRLYRKLATPITRTETYTTIEDTPINPTQQQTIGTLLFYRYDNVEPGDVMRIILRDTGLIFYQKTSIHIRQDKVELFDNTYTFRQNPAIKTLPKKLYNIFLMNWDEHVEKLHDENKEFSVEEEIIQDVMNAKPITITELVLEPARQVPALESRQRFIEGTLKHL